MQFTSAVANLVELDRIRPVVGQTWPNPDEIQPKPGRLRPNSVKIRPKSIDIEPDSGDFGAECGAFRPTSGRCRQPGTAALYARPCDAPAPPVPAPLSVLSSPFHLVPRVEFPPCPNRTPVFRRLSLEGPPSHTLVREADASPPHIRQLTQWARRAAS